MFRPSILRSLITGLGIAVALTACTPENVSGPQASPTTPSAAVATQASGVPAANASTGLLGAVLSVPTGLVQTVEQTVSGLLYPVVLRSQPLAHPITVTRTIGVSGGVIVLNGTGLTITFARGALLGNTPITVTADSGRAVSYEFGPHGTQFHAPVTIRQDMSLTMLANTPSAAPSIHGGYAPNGLLGIIGGLLVHITEILNATTSIVIGADGKGHLGTSTFIIKHFSGYMLISA